MWGTVTLGASLSGLEKNGLRGVSKKKGASQGAPSDLND